VRNTSHPVAILVLKQTMYRHREREPCHTTLVIKCAEYIAPIRDICTPANKLSVYRHREREPCHTMLVIKCAEYITPSRDSCTLANTLSIYRIRQREPCHTMLVITCTDYIASTNSRYLYIIANRLLVCIASYFV